MNFSGVNHHRFPNLPLNQLLAETTKLPWLNVVISEALKKSSSRRTSLRFSSSLTKIFFKKTSHHHNGSDTGLQAVFTEVFPITSYDETVNLEFVSYDIEPPAMSALEALQQGETFSAALYVTFKLKDETGTKKERVYMGDLPMMTRRGTFVINGAERVIVSPASPFTWYLLRETSTSTVKLSTLSASFLTVDHGWKFSSTRTTSVCLPRPPSSPS